MIQPLVGKLGLMDLTIFCYVANCSEIVMFKNYSFALFIHQPFSAAFDVAVQKD